MTIQNSKLVFLKLGGSLITDKSIAHTARVKVITRLASEIKQALEDQPENNLIIGHGSGSFGHIPADKYGTRQGVKTTTDWQGFWEVWREAHELHQIVLNEFSKSDLKCIGFPPSTSIRTKNHQVHSWDTAPLRQALEHGFVPVIYGDVVFDEEIGGTILSTEELFIHLAKELRPKRILLAGDLEGVFADFPTNKQLIPKIDGKNIDSILKITSGAIAKDVTGGMLSKVESMWDLCKKYPKLQAQIFSAKEPSVLYSVLMGGSSGTLIQK
jgi:isopentenyl phosphate kinase